MATQLRVKKAYSNRKKILHIIEGRIVNFGAEGGYVKERPATKKTLADEILVEEPTQEDFQFLLNRGKTKFIEEFDEEVEAEKIAAIKAKKEAIIAKQEEAKLEQEIEDEQNQNQNFNFDD